MSYINVPVPEERVHEVYALLGGSSRKDPNHQRAVRQSRGENVYPPLTESLVIRMYGESLANHRAFMELLADRAGKWIYTDEIADALALPNGSKSVAGMLGAFGRRAKHRYGGAAPWEWFPEWNKDGAAYVVRYRITPEVAAWVQKAAREHRRRTI